MRAPTQPGAFEEPGNSLLPQHDPKTRELVAMVGHWQIRQFTATDPRVLIASRLRRFLDLSRDIDYSAKLVERDKKMRFADPALESKPRDWKLCFRAGKAATDTARALAQKWLSDLEARGVK